MRIYSFECEDGRRYVSRKGEALSRARGRSLVVDHVVQVWEHSLPKLPLLDIVALAANREFEATLIAAFRKNRKLKGWVA